MSLDDNFALNIDDQVIYGPAIEFVWAADVVSVYGEIIRY